MLVFLLGACWILRIFLAFKGGQLFWPDEQRFMYAEQFLSLLKNGDGHGVLLFFSRNYAHPAFISVSSALEALRGLFWGSPEQLWVSAALLSGASVACIALVYAIARKSGAGRLESFIASFLMACSACMFYYSRHLLPYDVSMAAALLLVWIGWDSKTRIRTSFVCGLVAGFSFMLYTGYWVLVLTVLFIHWVRGEKSVKGMLIRGVAAGTGFFAISSIPEICSRVCGDEPFLAGLGKFTKNVNQGSFSEGAVLVWQYLWHAEHALMLLWISGWLVAFYLLLRRRLPVSCRGFVWFSAVAWIYFILLLCSNILEIQVVYGRTSRQLVPFFCLTAAYVAGLIFKKIENKKTARLIFVFAGFAVLGQAAVNFTGPLSQQYPSNALKSAVARCGAVARGISVYGTPVQGYGDNQDSLYVLLNAQYLYPIFSTLPAPAGEVLFRMKHPYEYLPYQYEGFSPAERLILRASDISMRLIYTGKSGQNPLQKTDEKL